MNFLLFIILFFLMILIGRKRGLKAFIALLLNYFILVICIYLMACGVSILILTLSCCILVSFIISFFINGNNIKTKIAFISVIVTLFFTILFVIAINSGANLQGFGEEAYEGIFPYSFNINFDMSMLGMAVVLMGLIGSITDTAIAITSALHEVRINNPRLSKRKLFLSGMNIGRDILGTTLNTLFFAYLGGFLSLLFWFKTDSYTLSQILNSKAFCSEIVRILCSGLCSVIIIPVASFLYSYVQIDCFSHKKIEKT